MTPAVVDLFGVPFSSAEDVVSDYAVSSSKALASEFFVCSVIADLGFSVHHVPTTGYDALMEGDGRVIRIQVKMASAPVSNKSYYGFICLHESGITRDPSGWIRRRRPMDRSDADILALVAMDVRRICFRSVPLHGLKHVRVAPSEYRIPDIERLSLGQALSEV